jgi:hypothetical protein
LTYEGKEQSCAPGSQDQDQVKISIKDSGSGNKINTELYLNRVYTKKKRMGIGLIINKTNCRRVPQRSIKVLQSEIGKERCKLYLKKIK